MLGFLGFGKKDASNDRVVIVSRQEWDDLNADVRGLKRLADLETRARDEQNQRFAQAIDTVDARTQELTSLITSVSEISARNATEFSNRLDRLGAAVGLLKQVVKPPEKSDAERPESANGAASPMIEGSVP